MEANVRKYWWALATLIACSLASAGLIVKAQTVEAEAPAVAASPATEADDENAALLARSRALSEGERDRARQLFSTGFQLWQAGDFAAAESAFRDGLAIDPANAAANFYFGDVLLRRNDAEGERHLRRAMAFGAGSSEAYRAQAALAAYTQAAQNAELLIGTWEIRFRCPFGYGWGAERLNISSVDVVAGSFMGTQNNGAIQLSRFDETAIGWSRPGRNVAAFSGQRTSPTSIEGTVQANSVPCQFTAVRQ